MKIKILGTAAAEGVPGLFCHCDICENARRVGGKEIRTRSQTVINGELLIDLSADTYLHVLRDGLPLHNIYHCLISHAHSDHLYAPELAMRRRGFATITSDEPFTVYGSEETVSVCRAEKELGVAEEEGRVAFCTVKPFVPFKVMDYTVTPLPADHSAPGSVLYLIEQGGKVMLYGHDTGYFPDETWSYLERSGVHIDFATLDCCYALKECRSGHMGLDACADVWQRLKQIGAVSDSSVGCVNHFSHNVIPPYEVMSASAKKHRFITSYDGMEIDI